MVNNKCLIVSVRPYTLHAWFVKKMNKLGLSEQEQELDLKAGQFKLDNLNNYFISTGEVKGRVLVVVTEEEAFKFVRDIQMISRVTNVRIAK